MSGHSKWSQIRHKKGIADSKRGAIFTRHAKLITLAAQKGGGDPAMNPSLRLVIEKAKGDNMPNANIERAVKKGTGELTEGNVIEEIMYEGFGPVGTALYVHVLTDNKNRAVSSVKNLFNKNGGHMGGAGAVAWMFEHKGVMTMPLPSDVESVELMAIDAGAVDVKEDGDTLEIFTNPTELMAVKKKFEDSGQKVTVAELRYMPKDTVKISSEEEARKILKLVEALEEDEDVTNVYSNFDIPHEVMEKVA